MPFPGALKGRAGTIGARGAPRVDAWRGSLFGRRFRNRPPEPDRPDTSGATYPAVTASAGAST